MMSEYRFSRLFGAYFPAVFLRGGQGLPVSGAG
jgi:hypothetical protein